ncbi:MAG: CHAT domain-containing tetratricopeptide repeat protein [bacterium]
MSARELGSLDGTILIREIGNIPNGTAVSVSCAHLYRFADIEEEVFGSITTWSGVQYRWVTKERRYLPHMVKMIREILDFARKKSLFVTLFCEEYGPEISDLPKDLQRDDDLIVFAAPIPQDLAVNNVIPDLLQKLQADGIDAALSEANKLISDPKKQAQMASQLLLANGEFASAWKVLQPYLDDLTDSTGALSLAIAQVAFAAGMLAESEMFLKKALKGSLQSIEDLNSVYQLAGKLRLSQVAEVIFQRMKTEYPNHKTTLLNLYDYLFAKHDFMSACKIAKQLGDSFDVQLCTVFSKSSLDLEELLNYAAEVGRIDELHFAAALEAERRSEYPLARELASKVELDSPFISGAMKVRIRILREILLDSSELTENEIEELKKLMYYVANHPEDLDVRFMIDKLFEADLEEPASKVILLKILLESMRLSFKNNTSTLILERNPTETASTSLSEKESLSFFRDFLDSIPPTRGIIVGHGELPLHLEDLVTTDLLTSLLILIQYGNRMLEDDSDLNLLKLLFHMIVLISQKLNDHSSDLIALRSAIVAMMNAGFPQPARDLAETCLLTIPKKYPDQFIWRLSQIWASYSDACHRAGNIMVALRYLSLSFLLYNGPAQNYDLLASSNRIAVRILRDLGLEEYALETLAVERMIRVKLGSERYFLHQIDAVELSIQVSNLRWDTPVDKLIELFNRADHLIKEDQPKEIAPLVTLQASIYRIIKTIGAELPYELKEKFENNLKDLKIWQKNIVDTLLMTNPTRQNIIDVATKAAKALNWSDLSYQIKHITILAHNALMSATEHGDINLFILASFFLSQPILSLKTLDAEDISSWSDMLKVQRWWFHMLTEEKSPGGLLEGHNVVQAISPSSLKSISALGNISLDQIVDILGSNEAMMILCMHDQGILYRAIIHSDGSFQLERLESDIWSPQNFISWRKQYPRGYGRWEPPANLWDKEQLSKGEVRESVRGLSLWPFKAHEHLTVVPEAKLFGFPFSLTLKNDVFLGEDLKISVAPSIPWLISARSKGWTGEFAKKAWLGSPASADFVIHLIRNRLEPVLFANQVEVVESPSPIGFEHNALVIVVSHGGVGLHDQFRKVTDEARVYSRKEFASYFEGCGCVVLFVCNAGRSDKETKSTETTGLVADLLRNGVRCVIAPPWPLHVDITVLWLPPFLSSIASGGSISDSAYTAAREVSKTYDNPCAWGALQLFGDGTFVLHKAINS